MNLDPASLLAQKLNNRAAGYLEAGKYGEALYSLTEAMKNAQEDIFPGCICHTCTLDGCMAYSQSRACHDSQIRMFEDCADPQNDAGYIHQQPIRIPPSSMHHSMGLILPLIITYNLALVHQLSAMEDKMNDIDYREKLQRSLKLYELAYKWQIEEDVNSLAFNMILANNLGEIHRAADNAQKHEKCMKHLLSTMMYALISGDEEDEASIEMDGFFKNTFPLIFSGGCAGAA